MVPKMRRKGSHALVGIGAAFVGVALGVAFVYLNEESASFEAEAALAYCPKEGENSYTYSCNPTPEGKKCAIGKFCQEIVNGKPCTGTCQASGKCLGTACEGKALEGKPKEGPGGEPKLPELPKGGGGSGGQPPPKQDEECQKEPKPEHCEAGVSRGLLDTLVPQSVKDLFSSESTIETENASDSAFDRLMSFFTSGTSDESGASETEGSPNPTEAVVTPVVVGSSVGQVSAQGEVQAGVDTTVGIGPNAAVTGFGANTAVHADTSTGPILSAIKGIATRIQEILSSLF